MAARPSKSTTPDNSIAVKAFVKMAEFDSSPDSPLTLDELCSELSLTVAEVLGVTETLENAELIDGSGRGNDACWWINVPDVSEGNAESIVREALSSSVTVVETPVKPERQSKADKRAEQRARLEYATRAAETQDEVMSQSPQVQARDKVLPAETPVKGSDGEIITIPVDFDDPSKGRRELDASKGERLISEDTFKVRVTEPKSQDKGLESYVDSETGETLYESAIEKNGLALDEPSEIPACPNGVNRNTWFMAHAAITQTARDWWMSRAKVQQEVYESNDGAPAPF